MTETFAPDLDLAGNRAPIYIQLSTLFHRFIETGQWPINEQIPTIENLAVQFAVNPATIRRAIAILEGDGLVARFRRRGTFVTALPPRRSLWRVPTNWPAMISAFDALEPVWLNARNISSIALTGEVRKISNNGYRSFRRLYRRAGAPFMVEATAIEQGLRRTIGDSRLRRLPTARLIEECPGVRVTRADETIRFGIADNDMSERLDVALNAPLAVAHVSVLGKGGMLLCNSTLYMRGDMVQIAERIDFGAST